MKKLIYSFAVATFFLVACKNNSAPAETTTETTPTTEVAPEVATDMAELEISGDDQMKYDKTELKVKAGQKVKLTLTHIGKMPKDAMGHNWVLLNQGVDLAAFAAEAIKAKDNDYIPAGKEGDIVAHTKTIGGGESTSVEFDAPAAGTYEFLCSFPGHSGMMKGHFIVE
ncbi:MAG TPA: azurin [Saprospiraceae bacterium]|nr:azurin [Saprospiraceae bacterium]HRO09113.1 azurin [Saprospiraceae bacterium]HRP42473.1 azurin [Saprospiraceae bacterium]